MKEIPIRQLQKMNASEIKEQIPFWITKDGDKVCMLLSASANMAIFQLDSVVNGGASWVAGRQDWPDR